KMLYVFFFSSRRRHTRSKRDWSSDVCSSDLDDCWQSDLEALPEDDKAAYRNAFVDAPYTHVDLKRDVLKVLTDRYGTDVRAGDKIGRASCRERGKVGGVGGAV